MMEQLDVIQKEINQKENEILIGLEQEIRKLREHIENDDQKIDAKLKEITERGILGTLKPL